MLIKVIPETDAEKARLEEGVTEMEYSNVKEYFLIGTRLDGDNEWSDFQDWQSNHRYLISNLYYYLQFFQNERIQGASQGGAQEVTIPIELVNEAAKAHQGGLIKEGQVDEPNLQIIEPLNDGSPNIKQDGGMIEKINHPSDTDGKDDN